MYMHTRRPSIFAVCGCSCVHRYVYIVGRGLLPLVIDCVITCKSPALYFAVVCPSHARIMWMDLYAYVTQADPAATPTGEDPKPVYVPNADGVRLELPDDVQMCVRLRILGDATRVRIPSYCIAVRCVVCYSYLGSITRHARPCIACVVCVYITDCLCRWSGSCRIDESYR